MKYVKLLICLSFLFFITISCKKKSKPFYEQYDEAILLGNNSQVIKLISSNPSMLRRPDVFIELMKAHLYTSVTWVIYEHKNINGTCDYPNHRRRPIHYAAIYSNKYIRYTELLVDVRNVNINVEDTFGNFPIHYSAENCSLKDIRFFNKLGQSLKVLNNKKENLLHCCIKGSGTLEKKINVIKFLIDNGLDLNAATIEGKTPLMYEVEKKYVDTTTIQLIEFLLKMGANKTKRNMKGQTAYQMMEDLYGRGYYQSNSPVLKFAKNIKKDKNGVTANIDINKMNEIDKSENLKKSIEYLLNLLSPEKE